MKKTLLFSLILMFSAGLVLSSTQKMNHRSTSVITSAAWFECSKVCVITRIPATAGRPQMYSGLYYRYPVKAYVFARKLLNTY